MKTAFFVLNVLHCMTTCAGDTDFGVCPDLKTKDGMVDRTLSCGNRFFKACSQSKGHKCTLEQCKDHCAAREGCTTLNYKHNGACKLFHGCVGSKAYNGEGVTYFRKPTTAPSCPSNSALRTTQASRIRTTRTTTTTTTTTTPPTTTTTTTPPTTTTTDPICPSTCLGLSCDDHILGGAQRDCAFLETAGCDCGGCECPKVTSVSTTTSSTRNLTFAYSWGVSHGSACGVRNGSLLMSNVIHIGEDGKDFDHHVSPDDCRIKCGMSDECGGFTYHHLRKICRYKHHQPGKFDTSVKDKFVSCYVYNQPIASDNSALGVKPITAEEVEEALGWGFMALFVVIAVLVVLAGAAAAVLLVIKRRQTRSEVVVVRGLLVSDDGPPATTI